MKIALFSRVFPPQTGGMERFAMDLATWLAQRGHQVTVVGPPAADADADRNLPFRVVRAAGRRELVRTMRGVDAVHINGNSLRGELASVVAAHRPVVTHTAYQAICTTGLAWSTSGSCDASGLRPGPCAACPRQGTASTAATRLHRIGTHAARVNACVSAYQLQRINVPRGRVIYNPVATRAFDAHHPGPGTDGLIAFAGRLVGEKGLDVLLRALALLPGAELEIVGDGEKRAEWEQLASSLGVAVRVRFLGSQPFERVAELYARAAVVCTPSVWHEPFGYVVAEAMAMGRPVVATPSGAFMELLAGGRGFLARDFSPEALADVLRDALEQPQARATAGEAARQFAVANLGMDVTSAQYVDAYRA